MSNDFEAVTAATITEDDAPDAIVTGRVSDCAHPAAGAVERTCAMCDAGVWIAPSTLVVFAARVMPPIWCSRCALTVVRRGGTA